MKGGFVYFVGAGLWNFGPDFAGDFPGDREGEGLGDLEGDLCCVLVFDHPEVEVSTTLLTFGEDFLTFSSDLFECELRLSIFSN